MCIFTMTHDHYGRSNVHPYWKDHTDPQFPGRPDPIAFIQLPVNISGRHLYDDCLLFLFLYTRLETDTLRTARSLVLLFCLVGEKNSSSSCMSESSKVI